MCNHGDTPDDAAGDDAHSEGLPKDDWSFSPGSWGCDRDPPGMGPGT